MFHIVKHMSESLLTFKTSLTLTIFFFKFMCDGQSGLITGAK